jgi:RHS repeat-associated protein
MISPLFQLSSMRIVSIAIFLFLAFANVFGQEAARPDRGAAMNRNYFVSDIENINLQNGNVNLSVPLASLPPIAGGKLSWRISANYNSKIWDVVKVQEEPLGSVFLPYVVDVPSASGGWTIGGQYSIVFRNAIDDFDRIQYDLSSGLSQGEIDLLNNYQWWKVLLVMPDGSEHELRPLDHGSYSGFQDFLRGYYNVIPSGGPIRYYSLDGSYLYAKISSNVDWTVTTPDGTRIIQTPDGVQRIQDTNGNKIKIFGDTNGGHFQDEQTGREIRVVYDPAANGGQGRYRIFYPTVTGLEHFIDVNMGTTTVQGKTYPVNDFDPIGETICQRTAGMFTELQVVREIVFPQTEPGQPQRKFAFSYNSDTTENVTTNVNFSCPTHEDYTRTASKGWGELSRVIMPPGSIQNSAYVDYSYELDSAHSLLFSTDDLAAQGVSQKKLNHDGTVDTWTYEIGASGSIVTSPDGNNLTEARYCATFGVPGCSTDKAGLAYRTTQPFMMTERHWINLTFSGGDNSGPGGLISPFNAVVDYEYTTLLDASNNPLKMSAKKFQHDYNGNVTQTTEYDWFDPALVSRDAQGVPTGVPGSATVLRVSNDSHYNQAVASTSTNVYAKRPLATGTPLILRALKESTLGPSIVQYSYDGQAYGVAPTVGNLTTKKVWVDLDSKWITTSNTYGLYGNLATSTDGRGKVTQFFYDDATHALPNRVVVDPQNGTGTQTATTAYDYSTGVITSQTDANGQVSTIDYTNQLLNAIDPFGRPGIAKTPQINIGGTPYRRRITTTYLDSARQVIAATDLNAENDKLLKTQTTSDQLGRTILTEQTEDGTNYTISAVTKYLDMGRVTLTSRPRRSTAASTDSWTRATKDNAGRLIELATFGGATQPAWTGTSGTFTGAVITAYDANFTTVTDQAGKARRSMVDPFGRVRRVDEPDGSGSLGSTASPVQPTSYGYDVFGNLTTVTQGSQTRTFTYDSLSRLRTAVNPESGTVSYQYDDNNNVLVKTDARTDPLNSNKKVNTHYEYDSLNRLKRRWYNGSSSISDTTHNVPTLPPGVGATDEAKFYYDTQSLPGGAPSYSRGSAIGRLVAQTYGTGSNGDYYAYDVLGRATLKIQQVGTINYQMSATYSLSGLVGTLTYPSESTVTNTYDQAGRLSTMSGNLGDGATHTYATGILYSPTGGMVKEEFGTTTPVYNKLFYNSRGQLAEIRASSSYTGPTDTTWDRGAIVNSYSNSCTGVCSGSSMSDNNGNLLKQQIYIPGHTMRWQQYDYDSLNRLNWAREVLDGGAEQWKQQFTYDRWGNRTINTGVTYGVGINNKAFTVNTGNNRLGVPGGQPGVMTYDAAGNLTNDTYTGAGERIYDAENKITSAWGGNNQAQLYAYDANGQRIKRTVDGVQTWQVYGFGGELVAEYAASGAAANPQKEYGYRNGQLLVTAEPSQAVATNVALAANGATATASSSFSGFAASGAINGDRKGLFVWQDGYWSTNSSGFPAWLEVQFNGSKTISEIDVITLQNNYNAPVEPTDTMTFSSYGLSGYEVQYWNGSAWATITGGSVSGNNKVWRKFSFAPISTTKIRVLSNASPDGYSRLTEVEAWTGPSPAPRYNLALGATATASSSWAGWGPSAVVNGDRKSLNAGSDGAWVDAGPANTFPDWVQVDFGANKTLAEIDVFTLQDNYAGSSEPTEAMTFTQWGLTGYEVQYWDGGNWVTVSGGSVTGNNKIWRKFTFAPITTSKIRVLTNASIDGYSRLTEIEAYAPAEAGGAGGIHWLIADHLGTPRMVIDQTGDLANMKRHDYLPFGEELVAPTSGRSAAQGYAGGDGVRQQFTSKERDLEIGLDYSLARYYSPTQGRFTSTDPLTSSGKPSNPQTWNRYGYCLNQPLVLIDPDGLIWGSYVQGDTTYYQWYETEAELEAAGATVVTNFIIDMGNGTWRALNPHAWESSSPELSAFGARRHLWRYNGLPNSWQDWIPVWGQTRRLLFNYTVGNYEEALVNFSFASADGGTMAAGFVNGVGRQAATEGVEQGFLRFSQTTASPAFSQAGTFTGKSIGQLAAELRSGAISAADVPVQVIDGADGVRLIYNTRSALALTRAGIPQSSWHIIDMSASPIVRGRIQDRLIKNGLTNQGTDVLRITGMGKYVSNLQ